MGIHTDRHMPTHHEKVEDIPCRRMESSKKCRGIVGGGNRVKYEQGVIRYVYNRARQERLYEPGGQGHDGGNRDS